MSKIPAPPGKGLPLQSMENQVGTKRPASPTAKSGPPAKKMGPLAAAAAARAATSTAVSSVDCEAWDEVSAATGWSLAECLTHRLAFKKKEDPKVKAEAMGLHMRRLRAAGRHLLDVTLSQESDLEALMTDLVKEEQTREAAAAEAAAVLQTQRTETAAARAELAAAQSASVDQLAAAADTGEQLQAAKAQLASAHEAVASMRTETSAVQEQLAEARRQVIQQEEAHAQSQRYCGELQGYNSRLQEELRDSQAAAAATGSARDRLAEEAATLRGKLAATTAEAAASQVACTMLEAAKEAAAEDAARLRGEVAATAAARDGARADLAAAREAAAAAREAAGTTAEGLASEQAAAASLVVQLQRQTAAGAKLQAEVDALRASKAAADSLAGGRDREAADLTEQLAVSRAEAEEARSRVATLEGVRRSLHNTVLELKGNIRVFCRVRPAAAGACGETAVDFPAAVGDRGLDLVTAGGDKHTFSFDRVFGPAASQGEVFEEISQLVQSALDGYRVCIFAYGATGSGKTHTMLGSPSEHGMIPRAVTQLFASAEALLASGWTFDMKASMLECYNEEYRDLLGKGPPAGKKHTVSHEEKGGATTVSFLEAVDVSCAERVASLLERAMRQRAVGATALNEHSSRSHMVFMLTIAGTHAASGQTVSGALNLIDLAGSERLSRSLAVGDRLKETQSINKSLSALGDVIMALGNKEAHIPFRNSKLTWLLQPALGGSAKTLMFVNIAPAPAAAPESLCSLRFASKVNACNVGTASTNNGSISR